MPAQVCSTTRLEFRSEGTLLAASLYLPTSATPRAVVVMAPGLSAVAEQLAPQAEYFAYAGYAALTFDHARFGASAGEPRQEVDPVLQVRGYRDAVTFVRTREDLRDRPIVLWGASLSGGHVLQAGALDPRVAGVVSVAPFITGWEVVGTMRPDPKPLFEVRRLASEGKPVPTNRVVELEIDPANLNRMDSQRYFQPHDPTRYPTWRNELLLTSYENIRAHEPGYWIHRIAPRPLLMFVATDDTITPAAHAREAFARAGEPKRLVEIPGRHFQVYWEAGFDVCMQETVRWLETL